MIHVQHQLSVALVLGGNVLALRICVLILYVLIICVAGRLYLQSLSTTSKRTDYPMRSIVVMRSALWNRRNFFGINRIGSRCVSIATTAISSGLRSLVVSSAAMLMAFRSMPPITGEQADQGRRVLKVCDLISIDRALTSICMSGKLEGGVSPEGYG